jgi:hypothetical protein
VFTNPGVATAAEHEEAAVAHTRHERLVVEDQRIGLPASAVHLMSLEAGLELGRTVDLAGDQHGAVEQERRLLLFDDLEAGAFQRRAAGRRKLDRIEPGEADPSAGPELRVDQHREVPAAERFRHALHSRDVVPVAVAQDDRLDIAERQSQPADVFRDAAGCDARIEQQRALAPVLLDAHECGEAGLGDQRVRNPSRRERRGHARNGAGERLRPAEA